MEARPMQHTNIKTWLEQQLARITYKPGFKLSIVDYASWPGTYRPPYAEYALRITMTVEDTYNPGRTIEVGGEHILFHVEDMDERRFMHTVADFLKSIEIHEFREWFKVDGAIWDNPHAANP